MKKINQFITQHTLTPRRITQNPMLKKTLISLLQIRLPEPDGARWHATLEESRSRVSKLLFTLDWLVTNLTPAFYHTFSIDEKMIRSVPKKKEKRVSLGGGNIALGPSLETNPSEWRCPEILSLSLEEEKKLS